jgi:hypothetical protein
MNISGHALAQDERFLHKMISGELVEEQNKVVSPILFEYHGPIYQFDLNSDGQDENIQLVMEDGLNRLIITNHQHRQIFNEKLWAVGANSRLYKIKVVYLNPQARVLILFLDEGRTESVKYESTAKLFFVSIDNKDLQTLKMIEGPRYWHEKEAHREQYWRRNYSLSIKDLDGDGSKDIYVKYHGSQWIYRYLGKGQWTKI